MTEPLLLILMGVIGGLLLAHLFGRGLPGLPGCGCVTNVLIGLLLIVAGLVVLMVAGIIPDAVVCERLPDVVLCLN